MTDRWAELRVLQQEYKDFPKFVYVCMTQLLGFQCTWMQLDIAVYLQFGPLYRMIMAQRGEAKTTITAMYAVWRIIHKPNTRVLVISSVEKKSREIAYWIIQILRGMPELACLLPATNDRKSVTAFDVHSELKGPEKSPSIACLPIKGGMSGSRADVLIADDIETPINSITEAQRELLRFLSLEFASICQHGDIVYLGTPQSVDSVYNTLPSRGFDIRIWPGRYPTEAEEAHYGIMLAPLIRKKMTENPDYRIGGGLLGDRGLPTDEVMMNEEALQTKELAQGPAYFQLQYMLDTSLSDQAKYPLKCENLVFMRPPTNPPVSVTCYQSEDRRLRLAPGMPDWRFYAAAGTSDEHISWMGTHFYIDPAGGGQNGDETAWAVTRAAGNYIWLAGVGGIVGGTDEARLQELIEIVLRFQPNTMGIEKNFGHGMFASIFMPKLLQVHKCSLVEPWNNTQKETRIINTLEPLLGAGQLIVDPSIIEADWLGIQKYATAVRTSYSFFHQLSRITRDRGVLLHDDRLDAVAGACHYWMDKIKADQSKLKAQAKMKEWAARFKDPLGTGRKVRTFSTNTSTRVARMLNPM